MGYTFSTYLTVKNRDEFRRVLEFAQSERLEANPEKLELSWTGETSCEKAESVVAQFPDIEFRICDSWDLGAKYGLSENGKIRWLELSDDVNEMMDWGIDVDPFTEPTSEQFEELRQHRRARVQEMINLGVHISPDTWPPTKEQIDEDYRLRYAKNTESKTDNHSHEDNPDLPF